MKVPFKDVLLGPDGLITRAWHRYFQDIGNTVSEHSITQIERTGDNQQKTIDQKIDKKIKERINLEPTPTKPTRQSYVNFIPETQPPYLEGRLYYDADFNFLTFYNDQDDIRLLLGGGVWSKVKNVQGSAITRGQAVHVVGSTGDNPQVKLAKADSLATARLCGLVAQDSISNNGVGYITRVGPVIGFDTSGYTEGNTLYLSPTTAGGLTSTKPGYPNYAFRAAEVIRSDANQGILCVGIFREIDTFTTNYVIFANGNGELAESSDFQYDDTNKILKVASASVGNLPTTAIINYHGI